MVRYRLEAMKVALVLFTLLSLSQAQSDDQGAALRAIKDAVGGMSTNLTSWNTTSRGPCLDKWMGVTCDDSNKIIGLNFSQNNLREGFPQSIVYLTNLVELRLDNNFLTGPVPEKISDLKLLEQLWLGNNTLSGALPLGLSSLTHLQAFTAWGPNMHMALPATWGAWVNITYINLHNSNIIGTLPPEWGQNFTKLQRLNLYYNRLAGSIPDSWKGMKSLRELRLKGNDLTGPVPSWVLQLVKNNASVDLVCNFLTGPKPSIFSDSANWMGNCFDGDDQSHDVLCDAGLSCSDFINGTTPSVESTQNQTQTIHENKNSFPKAAIVGIPVAAVMVLCGILGFVYWARLGGSDNRRCRRKDQGIGDWMVPQGVQRLTYKEITRATKSFDKSCLIGEGGFGKVYVAQLDNGKDVAIKRASTSSVQGINEFQNEITLLSRLHHRHLVRLEGFCDDRDEQILVYEYMSNGNLHRHLLDKHGSSLNWYKRLEIALAVAQGLDYLHTFADPPVIHRDVKPSNILLDANMVAKVADFGISKAKLEMETHVSTTPAGTVGYWDPQYFLRRQLTTASDVYSYSVVLLELITGQRAIDHKRLEDCNIVSWVKPKLVSDGIHTIIDPRLVPDFPAEQYEVVAHLAMACTAFEWGERPSMQTVVTTSERVLSSLFPPPEHLTPFSSSPSSPLIKGELSNSQISSSMSHVKLTLTDTVVEPR